MLIPTVPGAVPWPAAIIVWGPGYQSAEHRHHCVQLVLTMRTTLRIRAHSRAPWTRCGAALVRANVPHEVDARDTPVLIAFVDPQSELGAALTDRIDADIQRVADAEVQRWRAGLGSPSALGKARVESWVRSDLLRHRRAAKLHPGVNRVLKYLRESLAEVEDLSLPRLARVAALSPSRFMHAFTESVGVPLRLFRGHR